MYYYDCGNTFEILQIPVDAYSDCVADCPVPDACAPGLGAYLYTGASILLLIAVCCCLQIRANRRRMRRAEIVAMRNR